MQIAQTQRIKGGEMENKEIAELEQKIAYLESLNDQLSTEVSYIDQLMKLIGFAGGLDTIKATANEIIKKGYNINNLPE